MKKFIWVVILLTWIISPVKAADKFTFKQVEDEFLAFSNGWYTSKDPVTKLPMHWTRTNNSICKSSFLSDKPDTSYIGSCSATIWLIGDKKDLQRARINMSMIPFQTAYNADIMYYAVMLVDALFGDGYWESWDYFKTEINRWVRETKPKSMCYSGPLGKYYSELTLHDRVRTHRIEFDYVIYLKKKKGSEK